MNTSPPKGRLRPSMGSDKITIDRFTANRIIAVRYTLERAGFFFGMIDDVRAEDGRWARVHSTAVLDAGALALDEAIKELDLALRGIAGSHEALP